MKATFEKTLDILVKAYMNDTLVHSNCFACAVGNIIAARCGFAFVPCIDSRWKRWTWASANGTYYQENDADWYEAVVYGDEDQINNHETQRQIAATGYTIDELKRIEWGFENAPRGVTDDEYMFNGLMAVVDVLADIHGIDLKQKEAAKLLFVK